MTSTMPRPPKTDRSTVRDILITLKLSKAEKETLLACVADRSRELEENSGERIEVTASSYLRWLIDRDAKGLVPALSKLLATARDDDVRLRALWALEGLGAAPVKTTRQVLAQSPSRSLRT